MRVATVLEGWRALCAALAWLSMLVLCEGITAVSSAAPAPVTKIPMTVAAATATTRINEVSVSPDGSRYIAVLVRGDVERNGVWIELIGGSLDSLDSAARVATVARFFTSALGPEGSVDEGASELTFPTLNPITWLDANERVALRFGDGAKPIQIVAVNTRTPKIEFLTKSRTDVVGFSVGPAGSLLYITNHAHAEETSARLLREGFNVTNQDVHSLLRGSADGYSLREYQADIEIFVSRGLRGVSRPVTVSGRRVHRFRPYLGTKFSPTGDQIILDMTPVSVPDEWSRYTGRRFPRLLEDWRRDARGVYGLTVHQLFVVDVATGQAHALWNAPACAADKTNVTWSPDGRSVLVTGTYLPVSEADAAGMDGRAVAEVDPATGRFQTLPVPPEFAQRDFTRSRWQGQDVAITAGEMTLRFRKIDGAWKLLEPEESASSNPPEPAPGSGTQQVAHAPQDLERGAVKVMIRQDPNTPPKLYAVERASGREKMIFDPNPGLTERFTLGRVEPITWPDSEGRTWSGLLYYPVNYQEGRRFPLVVQTHGHAPVTDFSLYGNHLLPGLGPGYAAFAAQPLANRDIAVLHVEDKILPLWKEMASPREAMIHADGYESGIESLVKRGLVDRNRVGIVGYSRTGWYVEQALTQSEFPYLVAVSSDSTQCSYLTYTVFPGYCETENGAAGFGEGLAQWLEHAPAFNVERIYAAMLLEETTGPLSMVLDRWELFSRLRQLNRPVELHVIPDIAHGSHAVQNPAQVISTKQGAVDWFAFWLTGYEALCLALSHICRPSRMQKRFGCALILVTFLSGISSLPASAQTITIQGKDFYKDGKPWLPKGVDVNAFVKSPKYFSFDKSAQSQRGYWGTTELKSVKEQFHVDTLRFHISQAGLDPKSVLYDPVYLSQILEPVQLARQSGFAVVLVLDGQQDGTPDLKCMPSESTARAWSTLAPRIAHMGDVVLEVFNEPCKKKDADTQQEWAQTMQLLVDTVRGNGSQNVLLLDGLDWARTTNGLFPLIHDTMRNRLALGVHPYLTTVFSTEKQWHDQFGASAGQYPLIASEWNATPTNGCVGPDTPRVALLLMRYLEKLHVGLIGWGIESNNGKLVKDHTGFEPTDYSTFTDCSKTPSDSGGGKLLADYPND